MLFPDLSAVSIGFMVKSDEVNNQQLNTNDVFFIVLIRAPEMISTKTMNLIKIPEHFVVKEFG